MAESADQIRRVQLAHARARENLDAATTAKVRGDLREHDRCIERACDFALEAATTCLSWNCDEPLRADVMLLAVELTLECGRIGLAQELLPFLAILAAEDTDGGASFRRRLDALLAAYLDSEHDESDEAALESWRWVLQGISKSREVGSRESIYDSGADNEDRYQLLMRALDSLPEADRRVVVRHTYDRVPWEELAHELGLEDSETARGRYQRAMLQVAKQLRTFGQSS